MILCLNTAEEWLQLVLADDEGILESFEERCSGRMSEMMAPSVADLLERHGGHLERVACIRGPGSFTGVRLGLAFCHGLCLARQLPLAGLNYLPLLAASAPNESGRYGEVHVITHSRTARVYLQGFAVAQASGPFGLTPLGPPQDLTNQAAREIITERARSASVAVLGSGLRRNPEAFTEIAGVTLLPVENPTPEALLAAALTARYDGPPVEALYLRGSDAEENLAALAAKRGLSEEEALKRMKKALG